MPKHKKTEVEIIEAYLKSEGFRELTAKEKKTPEFRDAFHCSCYSESSKKHKTGIQPFKGR